MSSNSGKSIPHDTLPSATKVVAMFVCPGAKEVPIPYAIYPHGFGFTEMKACPGRDICLWHAPHDLGETLMFNELPEHMLLAPQFQTRPYFSCPNFRDHVKHKRCRSCRGATDGMKSA